MHQKERKKKRKYESDSDSYSDSDSESDSDSDSDSDDERYKRKKKKEKKSRKRKRSPSPSRSRKKSKKKDKKDKKKDKKDKKRGEEEGGDDSQLTILEKCEAQRPFANAIASPMADASETKKILGLVHKAAGEKQIRRGVKEVVKAIRKNEKGICVIAGDISPIDVVTHIPVLCENAGIPYAYVPSKEALGFSCFTKRPTSVVVIKEGDSFKKDYEKTFAIVKALKA
uniref:H/ACA ribonucleoprotein complex subunit 2 n=1 Tax=Paramoeba aestuarina TaxID=180227 RepID=A0A7S4L602_9EUKA|mmetsp:Transcript_31679/g.49533  ORF Transcript_31679/g.49533 Transcript_31679/m.49533 type:complete len:227 (+) Transcript_31679:165-845(+)